LHTVASVATPRATTEGHRLRRS